MSWTSRLPTEPKPHPPADRYAVVSATEQAVLIALRSARTAARERCWAQGGRPGQPGLLTVDIDAILVVAHSEKEQATKTFGFHPLGAWVDHGCTFAVAGAIRGDRSRSPTHVTR